MIWAHAKQTVRKLSLIGHTITELNNIAHSLENNGMNDKDKEYKADRVYDSNNIH